MRHRASEFLIDRLDLRLTISSIAISNFSLCVVLMAPAPEYLDDRCGSVHQKLINEVCCLKTSQGRINSAYLASSFGSSQIATNTKNINSFFCWSVPTLNSQRTRIATHKNDLVRPLSKGLLSRDRIYRTRFSTPGRQS